MEHKQGDPVDPIIGAFYAEQTDFILPDIHGEFRLMRRHESVKTHKKQPLGSCWVSSLGIRLTVDGDRASMLKEDLFVEEFKRTENGWVNGWGEDRSYEMKESGDGYQIREHGAGKTYSYNREGCLTAIRDAHGSRTEIIAGQRFSG